MPTSIRIVEQFNNFDLLANQTVQRIDTVCAVIAMQIQAYAQVLIQSGPKTGRLYKRGNVVHQASAPGEPPATDTGNLVNSGYARRQRRCLWWVGFSAEYAAALECGTPRMLPRPYLRPAVERYRGPFHVAIKQAVGR